MVNKLALAFGFVAFFVIFGVSILEHNQGIGIMSMSIAVGVLFGIGIFATTWYDRKKELNTTAEVKD